MRKELQAAFESITWARGGRNPRSGPGSSLKMTENLREALPILFQKYGIKKFVDAPCGDWHWMQKVDLFQIEYFGADISSEIVRDNEKNHARDGVVFAHLDVTSDSLPDSDLFMCRDCLFHLEDKLKWDFFRNFSQSNGKYLLTTINHVPVNEVLQTNGRWTPFNPLIAPFFFPKPLELIVETAKELPDPSDLSSLENKDQRSIALWSVDQIREALSNAGQLNK